MAVARLLMQGQLPGGWVRGVGPVNGYGFHRKTSYFNHFQFLILLPVLQHNPSVSHAPIQVSCFNKTLFITLIGLMFSSLLTVKSIIRYHKCLTHASRWTVTYSNDEKGQENNGTEKYFTPEVNEH